MTEGRQRRDLLDPTFNLRECAKQLLLVEDHLFHPYKRCPDCIRKHLMTVEAFAEEARTLNFELVPESDRAQVMLLADGLAELCRFWMENVSDALRESNDSDEYGARLIGIAQEIRKVRKELVAFYHDPRQAVMRVASAYLLRR